MDKIWDPGLQQFQRTCDKCKTLIIEDEVRWFKIKDIIICEDCFLKRKKEKKHDNNF
jgi:hypothetical protein